MLAIATAAVGSGALVGTVDEVLSENVGVVLREDVGVEVIIQLRSVSVSLAVVTLIAIVRTSAAAS